jgi:hypothetical protein
MSSRHRLAALAAIAFGVLAPISVILQLNVPTQKGPMEDWSAHLASADDRATMLLGGVVMAGAVLALGWWLIGLGRHLVGASEPHLRSAALMAGGVMGGLLLVAATTMLAVPGTIEIGGAAVPSGELGLHIWYLGFWLLLVPVSVVGSFFIVTTVLAGHGVLPGWLRITGWVSAPILLTAPYLVVTLIALPLFVALTGIVMLRTRGDAVEVERTVAPAAARTPASSPA